MYNVLCYVAFIHKEFGDRHDIYGQYLCSLHEYNEEKAKESFDSLIQDHIDDGWEVDSKEPCYFEITEPLYKD